MDNQPFHEREQCSVERIGNLNLVCVLAEEKDSVIDELADNEAHDFPEVPS
jgi:hypothetical protein